MVKRILILYSDTGGGHRSAGTALSEALVTHHGSGVSVQMVDLLQHHAPYPFNRFPNWYPIVIKHGLQVWGPGFKATDGPRRSQAITGAVWPYVRHAIQRFVRDHPADVIVSVHPLLIAPVIRALGPDRPPFVTVVTDLFSVHALWYYPNVDLCIVPTELGRARALQCGLLSERVRVVGLPVAARFCAPDADKTALRARLGWGASHPIVLIVGGGEGMGPLVEIAQAIAASGLRCELVIIAGRNEAIHTQLVTAQWAVRTHIYRFVSEMPDFMRAADVLVTKAGPGTIMEAFSAGLPMILYGYLPGQEGGNVTYVVDGGAGVWAPQPEQVVETLRCWIGPQADAQALARVAASARRLARPNAAQDIARIIVEMAREPA